jgi:hypothetical protein
MTRISKTNQEYRHPRKIPHVDDIASAATSSDTRSNPEDDDVEDSENGDKFKHKSPIIDNKKRYSVGDEDEEESASEPCSQMACDKVQQSTHFVFLLYRLWCSSFSSLLSSFFSSSTSLFK